MRRGAGNDGRKEPECAGERPERENHERRSFPGKRKETDSIYLVRYNGRQVRCIALIEAIAGARSGPRAPRRQSNGTV
ncbi:MAG: hypothetical protein A49_03550 [Methyloceanibacter sp.]|nr:MAG: hypothetical protein A49_03550 [Methyloceanibacter sp.]